PCAAPTPHNGNSFWQWVYKGNTTEPRMVMVAVFNRHAKMNEKRLGGWNLPPRLATIFPLADGLGIATFRPWVW
ncbi:MAG: hypothetical protein V4733_06045, partial [Verrucomicrobiota bacterium]